MRKVIFALLTFWVATIAQAESLTIASHWKGETLDYSFGKHPFSWIVRTTVLPALTHRRTGYSPGGIRYSLSLADSLKMEGDFSRWYFRLAKEKRFTSGDALTVADIEYSLERCQQQGLLKEIQGVSAYQTGGNYRGDWVAFDVISNQSLKSDFPAKLSECPILQSDISRLFDRENSKGTALVGAGSHAVTEFDLRRKQLELTGIYRSTDRVQSLNKIVLRGVASDREGLTALRVGTVDILIFREAAIKALVHQDDTLRSSECASYFLAYRKDLKVACDPLIDFNLLRYGR